MGDRNLSAKTYSLWPRHTDTHDYGCGNASVPTFLLGAFYGQRNYRKRTAAKERGVG